MTFSFYTIIRTLSFETIKIFNTNSYKIYLLGCIFLIVTNFAVKVDLNKKVEKETFGDLGMFKARYIMNIDYFNTEIKRLENILEGKDSLTYFNVQTNEIVETKNLEEDDMNRLEEEIQQYRSQIDVMNSYMNQIDKLNEAYANQDGKNYYYMLSQIFGERWEMIKNSSSETVKDLSSTISLNNKIFNESSKNNTAPLVMIEPFYSTLDQYKDLETNKELSRKINIYSQSGPMFLYNLFWNTNLALILVCLAAIMVISGFTTDTEDGKQIEFMFTSSLKRSKIYSTKVFSQFLYSCLTIISMMLMIFILGFIADGIKGYNLPIANYIKSGFELIPLWKYLMRVISGIIALILLFTCLMNFLSIYIKNKLSLLASTALILVIASYLTSILPASVKMFSPLSYLRVDMLADQSISVFENIPNANYLLGILVIIIWSVIFFIIGRIALSRKKDII